MILYGLTIAYYKSDRFYTKIRQFIGKILPSTYEMKIEYTVDVDDSIDISSNRDNINSESTTLLDIQERKAELEKNGYNFTIRSEDESHNPVKSGKKLRIDFNYKSVSYNDLDKFISDTSDIVRENIKLLDVNPQDEKWVLKSKINGGEFLGSHLRNLQDRDVNQFSVNFEEDQANVNISSDTLTIVSTESEKIKKILGQYIQY